MNPKEIAIAAEELFGDDVMKKTVCMRSVPSSVAKEEFMKKARFIDFEEKKSTPWDDDIYWLCQSPFDDKWYLFAQFHGSPGYPSTPASITDERPEVFDAK